jgi:hypothetical protein
VCRADLSVGASSWIEDTESRRKGLGLLLLLFGAAIERGRSLAEDIDRRGILRPVDAAIEVGRRIGGDEGVGFNRSKKADMARGMMPKRKA